MPVDVKAILAASEQESVIDPEVMSLLRLAQSNRTFRRAKELKEQQEYNALTIAQGQDIVDATTVMDSPKDIELALSDLNEISTGNKRNKLVTAAMVKYRGALENTKELSIGRLGAVESLNQLEKDIRSLQTSRGEGGLYNEQVMLELRNNAQNLADTQPHFMDTKLRARVEADIAKLTKTINVYNMYEFYDTDLATTKLDFEKKPGEAKYLSVMQQDILQQSKNYADAGLIDEAAKTLAMLPRVGTAESKIYATANQRKINTQQIAEHKSELTDIIQEQKTSKGIIGEGVESKLERDLPPDLKEDLGGMLILLPSSPQSVAGEGGARTVQGSINQSQDMLGIVLSHAVGNFWSKERLDDIKITKEEASYLELPAGSDLSDVYDAYGMVVSDEEKAPYMRMLAHYLAQPKHAKRMIRGFKGGDVVWERLFASGGTPEEHNAVKLMSGVARTINKLYDLQSKHYGQFPISKAYDSHFQSQSSAQTINDLNWD